MKRGEHEKNFTAGYTMIQIFYWMNFAAVTGFTSVFLLHAGFSNTWIGILTAVSGAATAVLQPVVASYADRPESPSLKKILLICCGLLILMTALLLPSRGSLGFTGLFYVAAMTLHQLLQPLLNSLGMETLNQGKRLNFGIARGIGSGFYGISAYVLGLLVAAWGADSLPPAMLLVFAALLGALALFSFQKGEKKRRRPEEKVSGGMLCFFRKYRRFCMVLLGCVFTYIGHVLINNFAFQIVESKGGGSSEMGLAMGLAAVLELPTMFAFTFLLKMRRVDFWVRLSSVFFLAKVLGTWLAPGMTAFFLVQIFQMPGWALLAVSSVYYVNSVMEEQDVIKGQAYMTMSYMLGCVLGALIGGAVIDAAGVNTMLMIAAVSSLAGMAIVMTFAGGSTASER